MNLVLYCPLKLTLLTSLKIGADCISNPGQIVQAYKILGDLVGKSSMPLWPGNVQYKPTADRTYQDERIDSRILFSTGPLSVIVKFWLAYFLG